MRLLANLMLLLLLPNAQSQAANTSAYTDFDLKKCQTLEENADVGGYFAGLCEGYNGIPHYFAEGDLRGMEAFGEDAKNHCAARQSFGPFNAPGLKLEWRLKDGVPIAVIHRWTVSDPQDDQKSVTWLVVTKLEDGNSCRVAAVEGVYPNANEEARKAADTIAPTFNCAEDAAKIFSRVALEAGHLMSGTPCPKTN